MIDLLKFLFLIILSCFLSAANAQSVTDTLQLSRNYSEQKDYYKAIELLKAYTLKHPEDKDALQLLGLNYYWGEQYKVADLFYSAQLELNPQFSELKLDYARMLYERKQFVLAKVQLVGVLEQDPNNVEAREYSGFIKYWAGAYKAALTDFNNILKNYPENAIARDMAEKIEGILSPYVLAFTEYSFDSQPMESGISTIETGKYYSPALKPVFRANYLYFNSDTVIRLPWFQLGNELSFFKNKTHLNVELGVFKNVRSETQGSGIMELTQGISDKLSIRISGKRQPYFYTLGSMKEIVSFTALNASVFLTNPKGINMQISGEKQIFMDKNKIDHAFLWIMSPKFGWNALKFNLGYGYSYTDAELNYFSSVLSLEEILTDYTEGEIEGIYNPYFTPENQHIHTLIGTMSLSIKKKFELVLKGNVGFYAYADIPYLYLDKDTQNNLFINMGFSKEIKVPYEISTMASYFVNRKITINAKYVYTENFFYYNNVFNLSFKYLFL